MQRLWSGSSFFRDAVKSSYLSPQDITAQKRDQEELARHRDKLEQLVRERTEELQKIINTMAGREIRMAELKNDNERLQRQLEEQ